MNTTDDFINDFGTDPKVVYTTMDAKELSSTNSLKGWPVWKSKKDVADFWDCQIDDKKIIGVLADWIDDTYKAEHGQSYRRLLHNAKLFNL